MRHGIKACILAVGLAVGTLGNISPAAARNLPEFTKIAEDASAAVVNISTTQKQKVAQKENHPRGRMPDLPEDSPFNDFFRKYFGDKDKEDDTPDSGDVRSLGSGFIISRDGYVLTNHHVVNNADEIIVRLSDRRQLVAKLIGSDKRSDVALLKIDAQDLPTLKIGKSQNLKVGEWVLAIGSPFDFDHTVTAGIVSAVVRSLPSENYVPFIQTDVAINPGNSGGPLFNMDGEVVGINSQIYSRTGGFMGLSFAIPMDLAMNVVEQIKANGKVARGWLGVVIQDVTRELAESFGMKVAGGALVSQVLPDSPAAAAGIMSGDVILEFDGKAISDSSNLPPIVGSTRIGAAVGIKVMRDGKMKDLKVTLAELPAEDDKRLAGGGAAPDDSADKRLGVVAVDLTAEQRKELEIEKGGVRVQSVKEGAAQKAGVRGGDIILMLNGIDIQDAQHLKKVAAELPKGKSAPLLVMRRDGRVWLAVKIPEDKASDGKDKK